MNTNTNTYTIKTNPDKYDNLHKCDQKYWKFSCDFSTTQNMDTLARATQKTIDLLSGIIQSHNHDNGFKPENVEAAVQLLKVIEDGVTTYMSKKGSDLRVATFVVYQFQRWAFRIWYRDTKAARDRVKGWCLPSDFTMALTDDASPAKPEKKPAEKKAPAKQEKKPAQPKAEKKAPAKKAPAKQDIAKANEATFVSKLTKAQKKELVIALMAELLK